MPTETPVWFNVDQYLANKTAQTNAIAFEDRSDWTVQDVADLIQQNNMTPYEHFVRYGNAENVSPNDYFNVAEYFVAKTNQMNAIKFQDRADWTPEDTVKFFESVNMSAWDHYTQYGAAEEINPSNQFDTHAYLVAKANQLNRIQHDGKTDWNVESTEAAIRDAGLNPIEHYFLYGEAEEIPVTAVPAADQVTPPDTFNPWAPDLPGPSLPTEEHWLTTGFDDIPANDGANMVIYGHEFDGANTLQTGDRIHGGAGDDILYADVTAGNTFGQILNTVRPTVEGVETLKFTSQQSTNYTGGLYGSDEANVAHAGIRADRIKGAKELWSSESRADLHVEDVRIDSNLIKIGFQDADSSHGNGPDMEVHFNNQNLKANAADSSSTIRLELLDVESMYLYKQPLLTNQFTSVSFGYNGKLLTLNFGEVKGPNATFDTLLDAINKAIRENPDAAGLHAELGAAYDAVISTGPNINGQTYGLPIIITADNPTLDRSEPGSGWHTADGNFPTDGNFVYRIPDVSVDEGCPLTETAIALDNVGMVEWNANDLNCVPDNREFGDHAGDMIVGGMGNGKWVGVQRFDVEVDGGSWLSSLASTNKALRMVTVRNTDLDGDKTVGTSDVDKGNLFIGDGQRLVDNAIVGSLMFEGRDGLLANAYYAGAQLPGATNPLASDQGLLDVKTFNAAAMTGKANISAAITDLASEKYLGDTDQVDGLGNRFAPDGDFEYKFGGNDDTLNMSINGFVAADNDFKMNINMGDGNNSVHTDLAVLGSNANWLQNQFGLNNIHINAGSGKDIINTWGNGRTNVNAGAGNDVVYADNSGISGQLGGGTGATTQIDGVGAIFVVNAKSGEAKVNVADNHIVPYQNDILSGFDPSTAPAVINPTFTDTTVPLANGTQVRFSVTVEYKGISHTVSDTLIATANAGTPNTGTVRISAHDVNDLIARAVNSPDSWLSSIMSAQEGAGESLMLISKIDGQATVADNVAISFSAIKAADANQTTPPQLTTLVNAVDTHYNTTYKTQLAQDAGGTNIVGEVSTAQSYSTINLGEGDDLAVLSTSARSHDIVVLNNANNGTDTIINFDAGQDMLDVRAIFNGSFNSSAAGALASTSVAVSAIESGLASGTSATALVKQIVYVENDPANAATHIGSVASMQAALTASTATYSNNITLFMVHEQGDTDTFHMYRAEYGATAVNTPTVTDLGVLNFGTDSDNNAVAIIGTDVYDLGDMVFMP